MRVYMEFRSKETKEYIPVGDIRLGVRRACRKLARSEITASDLLAHLDKKGLELHFQYNFESDNGECSGKFRITLREFVEKKSIQSCGFPFKMTDYNQILPKDSDFYIRHTATGWPALYKKLTGRNGATPCRVVYPIEKQLPDIPFDKSKMWENF